MTDKKLVYIASPYAGDIEYNTRMAIKYCRYAAEHGVIPLAPHLHTYGKGTEFSA